MLLNMYSVSANKDLNTAAPVGGHGAQITTFSNTGTKYSPHAGKIRKEEKTFLLEEIEKHVTHRQRWRFDSRNNRRRRRDNRRRSGRHSPEKPAFSMLLTAEAL